MTGDGYRAKQAHKVERRRLREYLRGQGVAEIDIRSQVESLRRRQLAERERMRWTDEQRAVYDQWHQEREKLEDETWRRLSPDDRRFRPKAPDPLLTGAARAEGQTAQVVKSRRTITRWQYDERDTKEPQP